MSVSDNIGNSEAVPPEPSLFTGNVPIKEALHQLKLRLLDLTGRNRLINFKNATGKALQFVHSDFDGAFKRMVFEGGKGVTLAAVPEPPSHEWEMKNGRSSRPDVKAYAAKLGVNTSYDLAKVGKGARVGKSEPAKAGAAPASTQLRTLYYADELGKHGRKIEREARLAIEETGSNMLYLVFGFLEFPESPASDKLYQAPLLCVPVNMTLTDEGKYTTFTLTYSGDELTDNLSLREKAKRDFGLNLPSYKGPEDEEEGETVDSYLSRVAKAVEELPKWTVQRRITLALLSFANMLMVKDIDPDTWADKKGKSALLAHPLIRQVFEGRKESSGKAAYAEEYDIDSHPGGDLPLIYDADSSQHSALIDVIEGQNRVIEGPPGTGKSQTITNIVAASLHAGKTVLFVAEKLAALEVVKSRLALAGLENFVLELHSNKTNKKRVLEDLEMRINARAPRITELPQLLEQYTEKRDELRTYVQLLNTITGNQLDLTLHQVMWRAELNRLRCGEQAEAVSKIEYPAAAKRSATEFLKLCDGLKYLAEQFDVIESYSHSHPFWGFFPTELTPEDTIPLQHIFSKYAVVLGRFKAAIDQVVALLGTDSLQITNETGIKLINVLSELAPADPTEVDFSLLPVLFSEADPKGIQGLRILKDIQDKKNALAVLEQQRDAALSKTEPVTSDEATAGQRLLQRLKQYGLADHARAQLESVHDSLLAASSEAGNALKDLNGTAEIFAVPFNGTLADVARIGAMREHIYSAPIGQLHHRHPAMRDPGAIEALRHFGQQLQEIQGTEQELDTQLYLDSLPNDGELREAIDTLREGDKWYRPFQSRWRKAIAIHRRLARSKAKQSADDRLARLEALRTFQQRRRTWNDDAILKRLAGPSYAGEQTPLAELIAVTDWVASASQSLADHQVSLQIFDPLTVERSRLMQLNAHEKVVAQGLQSLQAFSQILINKLPGVTDASERIRTSPWTKQLQLAEDIEQVIDQAISLMASRVKVDMSAANGLSILTATRLIPEAQAALAEHAEGKQLLGHRFHSTETVLDTAFAAHTYGTLIKASNLPAPVERVLLSEHCTTNYARLEACIVAINKGWGDLIQFEKDISPYGSFELGLWAGTGQANRTQYVDGVAARTAAAVEHLPLLLPWAQYVQARGQCNSAGLDGFVSALETGQILPKKLKDAFTYRFYASIAQQAFRNNKALRVFSGTRHGSVREDFARIDKEIIKLRGAQVARECIRASRPSEGTTGARVDDKTEMRLLEHLIPQQRPRVPVRKMLRRAGHAIQALKPCFMMGPQAVAQFLEPGHLQFDIIIMDEASQLKPEQALGAIARGAQLVVVGDPKQLPPTSFFSRMAGTDGDGDSTGQLAAADAESILDVCIGHFQPVRTLRWHYRSQHESLIAFSNEFFYRGNLVVFPSPYGKSKNLGLRYNYVSDGVYDNQMNLIEAQRVVDAVVEHVLHRPESSLGIVTLNVKQRDLIAEMLEQKLKSISGAAEFKEKWQSAGMGLFVKNLENVQGDERDCIMISTTFGKPPGANAVRQNFGPISRQGGWRRLNVLFTRARKSVVVFSSMRPEDIIVDKSTPEGTQALRNYLEFARDGVLPRRQETGLPPDSDFEVAVLDVLRAKGYEVVPQLGVAGFRIDIAVKHPDHKSGYLAAIECDGASYHSGVTVRDRDRIRQEILESLGWRGRIWRIWSTDWFRNPHTEAEKLFSFLAELRAQPLPAEYADGLEDNVPAGDYAEPNAASDMTSMEEEQLEALVFDSEEDDLEVQVGDLVMYSQADSPDTKLMVRITANQTNLELGLIAESTPLGAVLLGATVGEEVVLRIPAKPPLKLLIHSIKRKAEELTEAD